MRADCFAFHDRIKFSSHSNVPQCRDHTRCFHSCEQRPPPAHVVCTYHLPSFLSPSLYFSLSPLCLSADTLTNFWRGQRPGAIRSEGFLLQRNHYIYAIPYRIYFRKANHRIPLQDIYSFNGTCRRGSNTRPIVALRRDQNSHHFSLRINIGQSIRELYTRFEPMKSLD